MDRYCKRLIEVDLPIKRISAHALSEKSVRHGHLSTMHIWWARRPLAACRAVLCASLWPDPGDEQCPPSFREIAREQMEEWSRNHLELLSVHSYSRFNQITKNRDKLLDNTELRQALLDFIADFSDWHNSTIEPFILTSQKLTKAAHEGLVGPGNSKPMVMDPFAGGGAIPLEALRVGADVFASDINDIPVLLNEILLQDLTKVGPDINERFLFWVNKIRERVGHVLREYYPYKSDIGTPFAYFWARQILCEAPGCGKIVPLIRNPIFSRKKNSKISIGFEYTKSEPYPIFGLFDAKAARVRQTVKGGAATCVCGFSTPVTSVRKQLKLQEGGADTSLLLAVGVLDGNGRKQYVIPDKHDYLAIDNARAVVRNLINDSIPGTKLSVLPSEKIWGKARMNIGLYGMENWDGVSTARQKLQLVKFQEVLSEFAPSIRKENDTAVLKLLSLAISKMTDYSTSLCRWVAGGEFVAATNGAEKKIGMMWDFVEVVQHGTGPGCFMNMANWISRVIRHLGDSKLDGGVAVRGDARNELLPEDSVDLLFTDPPYYSAIWYCDLADLFNVWLRRTLLRVGLPIRSDDLETKEAEIIRSDFSEKDGLTPKNDAFYESNMQKAFLQQRKVTKPDGLGVIIFAHKSTAGWEAILKALIDSGWTVSSSWPIETERAARMTALGQAALASSIHITCRPRENPDGSVRVDDTGDWRDVLGELPKRIHDWMPRLAEEGIVGADAIFSCLGPALEIYSRYSSVEKASGHCHVNRVGPQRPAWIPFQAGALALSHTLNASFRNRLNVSLLHK